MTWGNTGNRRIFLGWMSNWEYANQVLTSPWRNATTTPRELALQQVGSEIYLTSQPVAKLQKLAQPAVTLKDLGGQQTLDLTPKLGNKFELKLKMKQLASFSLVLSNSKGEELTIGYDKAANQHFIDRSKSDNVSFNPEFKRKAPFPS